VSENETVWIKKAIDGDENAFGFLVDRYQKPVFSLCYRMLGNSNDAEDAAQESFIRAYMHLKNFDRSRSFATWLLSIASHHCIDRVRKKQLPVVPMEALPEETIPDRSVPNPEAKFRAAERDLLVQNLMMSLQPLDRAAITMRYWHGCTDAEIAETLNLTVSAVKSRLYRSRQALAELWQTMEKDPLTSERRPHESPAL
jgi:RNA polymerase sigma-70 factor, ECF subfamily